MNEDEKADELWRRIDATRRDPKSQSAASAPSGDRELDALSELVPLVGEALSSEAQRSSTREYARKRLSEVISGRGARWRYRPQKVFGVISAATATALIVVIVAFAMTSRSALHASELVSDHIALLGSVTAVQHAGSDAQNVSAWLESRVGFPVTPVLLDERGARLIGGRHCRLKGMDIGLCFYRCKGEQLSLFQLKRDSRSLAGLDSVRVKGRRFFVGADKGCNVVAWEGRDNFLVFVSACALPKLLGIAEYAAEQTG